MTHILKITIIFALISIKPIFIEGGLIITFGIVTGGGRLVPQERDG